MPWNVNLYGYVRMTVDLDIMIDLSEENVGKLLRAMDRLGYVPRLPVPPAELVSKEKREEWVSTAHADRQLFPVGETVISSVSLDTLIQMKEATGRPRDLEDVRHLRMIRALRAKGGPGGR